MNRRRILSSCTEYNRPTTNTPASAVAVNMTNNHIWLPSWFFFFRAVDMRPALGLRRTPLWTQVRFIAEGSNGTRRA